MALQMAVWGGFGARHGMDGTHCCQHAQPGPKTSCAAMGHVPAEDTQNLSEYTRKNQTSCGSRKSYQGCFRNRINCAFAITEVNTTSNCSTGGKRCSYQQINLPPGALHASKMGHHCFILVFASSMCWWSPASTRWFQCCTKSRFSVLTEAGLQKTFFLLFRLSPALVDLVLLQHLQTFCKNPVAVSSCSRDCTENLVVNPNEEPDDETSFQAANPLTSKYTAERAQTHSGSLLGKTLMCLVLSMWLNPFFFAKSLQHKHMPKCIPE